MTGLLAILIRVIERAVEIEQRVGGRVGRPTVGGVLPPYRAVVQARAVRGHRRQQRRPGLAADEPSPGKLCFYVGFVGLDRLFILT